MNITQKQRYTIIMSVCVILWTVSCFLWFNTSFKYHFYHEEQNQLFLLDRQYLLTYLDKPAWMACISGDYLTQFYYYEYAGATIVSVSLLLLAVVFAKCVRQCADDSYSFRQCVASPTLSLCLVTAVARLYLYENFKLSAVMALLGACVMMAFVYHPIGKKTVSWSLTCRLLMDILFIVLTAWMFGNGVFLLLTIMIARDVTKCVRNKRLSATAVSRSSLCIVLTFVTLIVMSRFYHVNRDKCLMYPAQLKLVSMNDVRTWEKTLMYDNEYYFGNYNRVIMMFDKNEEETTSEQCFFYCLSLAKMGMLPDRLMSMRTPVLGTFFHIDETAQLYTIKMINELYFILGDMTYAERAALMANTFSPSGRNVRMVKRLAEINLLKGDERAAMKYLRILEKTIVYRKWAEEHTPGHLTVTVSRELEEKRKYLNTCDDIRVGDDCYVILTQLLTSNPDNTIALDYLLCSDILSRQRNLFVSDYMKYKPRKKSLYESALIR